MTEAEWLACEDLQVMLDLIEHKTSNRKLRLFTHDCCVRIWDFFQSRSSQRVVELLSQVADDETASYQLEQAVSEARAYAESPEARHSESGASAAFTAAGATENYADERLIWVASRAADCARNTCSWAVQESRDAAGTIILAVSDAEGRQAEQCEEAAQAALLRDIFGNPFRPVAFEPAWRTSDVLALATGIYEEKAFDRMPILADALQDAGCDNEDVLNHCRGEGPHVRGCWVVDLVLGK